MKLKEHISKSYLTSFVLPPEGNGEDLFLKRSGMDENTDIYFLRGIGAQNFPSFKSNAINISLRKSRM